MICPFVVIRDTREQAPWGFQNIPDGADRKPLVIQVEDRTLQSGDYSIVGLDSKVSIERKSHEDLYGTLTAGRERFERELARLQSLEFSAVVVEASFFQVCHHAPIGSRVIPRTIARSIFAFQQRFIRTHWVFCDQRRFAEVVAFRMLERFWNDTEDGKRCTNSSC